MAWLGNILGREEWRAEQLRVTPQAILGSGETDNAICQGYVSDVVNSRGGELTGWADTADICQPHPHSLPAPPLPDGKTWY